MKFVPAIQGLRGLAACSVLVVHFYDMPLLAHFIPPVPEFVDRALVSFGHGVELFFIISGYLIPQSLIRHRLVSKFFMDRCLRILPLFIVLHMIVFTIGPLIGYKFFKGIDAWNYAKLFLANLLFLADTFGLPLAQQNAWTLTYEWLFYIWFALLYHTTSVRPFPIGRIIVIALGVFAFWYRPTACYFLLGYLFSKVEFRVGVKGLPGIAIGFGCIAILYAILQYLPPFFAVAGLAPAFLVFAMTLTPGSGFHGLLSAAPLQFLGKISYSLYLVHPFALFPLQIAGSYLAARGISPWLLWLAFATIGGIVSVAAATVTYELIEVRARKLINRWLMGSAAPRPNMVTE